MNAQHTDTHAFQMNDSNEQATALSSTVEQITGKSKPEEFEFQSPNTMKKSKSSQQNRMP